MENNPNQNLMDNLTPDSSATPVAEPVFSSTDLSGTKARSNTQYFTNIQKASLWQKISRLVSDINRKSLERSEARKEVAKAKREARRQAADLAAISAAVPTNIHELAQNPAARAAVLQAQQAAAAAQSAPAQPMAPAPQPAMPQPTAAPQQPMAVQPAPTPQPAPAQIMPQPAAPAKKGNDKITIIALVVVLILLVIGIILAAIQPWA